MLRRLCCIVLLVTTGCTSLQPVARPVEFVNSQQPKYVLVATDETPAGEDPLLFEMPRILNNQLVGYVFGDETRLPVERIQAMQATQYSRRRTMFAIVGSAVVVSALGLMIANTGKRIDGTCFPPQCGNFPH